MPPKPRYTSIEPPPDNGCGDCRTLNTSRSLCSACRPQGAPCLWCADRLFRVDQHRWIPCVCTQTEQERSVDA